MKRVHHGVVAYACFVLVVPVSRRVANGHVPFFVARVSPQVVLEGWAAFFI